MSDPFVKLYATLLESSLWWGEDAPTRLVWITLLVAADHEGIYQGTLPGLAGKARVALEEARHAVWRLQQPDEESRTKTCDGRRIEVIEGVGYKLLNYQTYRDKRSPKQVQDAAYKAAQRARDRAAAKPDMSGESMEVSRISLLESGSDPDPDPEGVQGEPPRELLPHEKAELRKKLEPPSGARPVGLYEFRPGWKPKLSHREYGRELGLTEAEMLERAEHCRLKLYDHPFPNEDKQFRRELLWARNDKQAREARKANPHGLDENPGTRRRSGDSAGTAFGAIGGGRPR